MDTNKTNKLISVALIASFFLFFGNQISANAENLSQAFLQARLIVKAGKSNLPATSDSRSIEPRLLRVASANPGGCRLSGGKSSYLGGKQSYKFISPDGVEMGTCASLNYEECFGYLSRYSACQQSDAPRTRTGSCRLSGGKSSYLGGKQSYKFISPDGVEMGTCASLNYEECFGYLSKYDVCK